MCITAFFLIVLQVHTDRLMLQQSNDSENSGDYNSHFISISTSISFQYMLKYFQKEKFSIDKIHNAQRISVLTGCRTRN